MNGYCYSKIYTRFFNVYVIINTLLSTNLVYSRFVYMCVNLYLSRRLNNGRKIDAGVKGGPSDFGTKILQKY